MKWYDWPLRIAAALLVVGVILHAILTFLTAPDSEAAVEDLREQLAQSHLSKETVSLPASVEKASSQPNINDIRGRWLYLLQNVEDRFYDTLLMRRKSHAEAFSLLDDIADAKKNLPAISEYEWALLRTLRNDSQDFINEARALTEAGMPKYYFRWFKRPENHFATVEFLLANDSYLQNSEGNQETALEDIISYISVSMAGTYAPWDAHDIAVMGPVIKDAVRSDTVTQQTRARLLHQLKQVADHNEFAEGLSRVSEMVLDFYKDLPNLTGYAPEIIWAWGYRYVGEPILNKNKRDFCEEMSLILELAPMPYWEVKPELERIGNDGHVREFDELYIWQTDPRRLSSFMFSYAFSAQAYLESVANLMRLGILLEQYKSDHGLYPECLDTIVDAFGGTLPVNAFTGEPYDYHRTDDGFHLSFTFQDDKDKDKTVEW